MAAFDAYKDLFPHAKLTRSQDGVLEVVLHTDGATLVFNGYTHEEFVELFHQIGQDARIEWSSSRERARLSSIASIPRASTSSRRVLRQDLSRGQKGPCKSARYSRAGDRALNGRRTATPSMCSCDIVIATPDTVFQDKPHFAFGSYRATAFIRSGRKSSLDPRPHVRAHSADPRCRGGENAGRHQRDRPA